MTTATDRYTLKITSGIFWDDHELRQDGCVVGECVAFSKRTRTVVFTAGALANFVSDVALYTEEGMASEYRSEGSGSFVDSAMRNRTLLEKTGLWEVGLSAEARAEWVREEKEHNVAMEALRAARTANQVTA